ncbi:MAG: phosphate/phosphite/phosphonate ABC transporter substrate-binding protein [Planctomycetes bacterium]|nr:phosphate/phosphite/phosphonate ABC transporter substrate-binding protein [Planctomycetota bacterium]
MSLLSLLGVALVVCQAPTAAPSPSASRGEPQKPTVHLSFGVYQTDKATVMYRSFTPLLDALQQRVETRLGAPVDIQLSIFPSYEDGIEALCKGRVDFVHFGPASYVTAKERNPGVQLLAMEHERGKKRVPGVVIVRAESDIRSLADLSGRSFAFGDPNSTIGRWLVQAEMVKAGLHATDLSSATYLERHDQVAAAVEHGDFDAGAVKISTFEKANAKNTLRVILTFDNVTKPVIARQGLDPAVFAAIQQSLFELEDPQLFTDLKISGFTAATDGDYQFVREAMKTAAGFERKRGG